MRHLAFFEVISEHADQADPVWVESVAGMLVLRFFEEWLDSPALASMNEPGIARMRQMIDEIANPEARHLLGTAVSVLIQAEGGNPSLVVGPLLAYARCLEEAGRVTLAEDVLNTVLEAINAPHGVRDLRLAVAIYHRLGSIALSTKRLDDADASYSRALFLCENLHDLSVELEIRIRLAQVYISRGNLGDAVPVLTTIIDRAQSAALQRIEALGRRVRGAVMQRQGHVGSALREYYLAYTQTSDELEKEYLFGDIATCASELGLRSTARVVHTTLARTAFGEETRSRALINLLEISVWDGDQETFNRLWKELLERKLPTYLHAFAQLYHASGIERWQSRQMAIEAYESVAEYAARTGHHHTEFLALEAAKRLQGSQEQLAVTATPAAALTSEDSIPSQWNDVTEAIEALCNLKLQTFGPTA
jgi:tetratricopeptide (TPR) repeat protein